MLEIPRKHTLGGKFGLLKLALLIRVILPSITVTVSPQDPSQLLQCAVLKRVGWPLLLWKGALEETCSRALSTRLLDESAPYARTPVIADSLRKSLRPTLVTGLSTSAKLDQ